MWRRFDAEGAEWEVRAIPDAADVAEAGGGSAQEVLEFRSSDGIRPPRRIVVEAGALAEMDEARLLSALRQARPIGADYYGRPGKHMPDVAAFRRRPRVPPGPIPSHNG
jgi:hypothetical protein